MIEQPSEQMNAIQEALHNFIILLNVDRDPTINRNCAEEFVHGRPIDDPLDRLVRRPIREERHQRQPICSVRTDSE